MSLLLIVTEANLPTKVPEKGKTNFCKSERDKRKFKLIVSTCILLLKSSPQMPVDFLKKCNL